ncbi:hypothetical protein AACH06_28885 [Ideonella sp. DXS29W]|uniref:WD40 repeat domain-containing protein n=1 Tax=Ideonella lacteola TaxID=2984193 RepID=A0ABU9BY04_9BURK
MSGSDHAPSPDRSNTHRRLVLGGLLAAIAVAMGTCMIQAQTGAGACGSGSASGHQVPLKELHIQQPMILFVGGGRLVRRNLVTGEDTLLSDHGFAMSPSAVRSADGRWLSYSGVTAGKQSTQYWLYDLQTDQDRLVLEHPAWGGSIPAISPDGRYLAIAANYDSRWPDSSAASTYVFDTETLRPWRLGIPAEAPAASAWTLPEWSADGARLLLMTRDFRDGAARPREYRSWTLGAPNAEPMEGRWAEGQHAGHGRNEWRLNDAVVPAFEQRLLQGQGGAVAPTSPSGAWKVKVIEHHGSAVLEFTDPAGRVRQADTAPYDRCEGYAIALIGWIDGEHLVYRKPGMETLVVEPATGRVARLLSSEHDNDLLFGW